MYKKLFLTIIISFLIPFKPVNNYLYAPWRSIYHRQEKTGCHFCNLTNNETDNQINFVLKRCKHCFIMLNLYPYNKGHLLIIPYSHEANLYDLSSEEQQEIIYIIGKSLKILETTLKCDGANVGLNCGNTSGASIPDHMHFHIVPRFNGDTGFMEALFDTKIISSHLPTIYNQLIQAFNNLE